MALNNPITKAPWGEYVSNASHLTIEQFAALPDEDGWTFELHQGRLIHMPGPGDVHSVIHLRLSGLLWTTLPTSLLSGLRSTNCYYFSLPSGDEVLCPDLSYIAPERVPTIVQRGSYLAITPDWVIEIASPNDYRPQLQRKMQVYLAAGVRLGWVIWPNSQTVDIWRPGNTTAPSRLATPSDILDGADVIPDLTLPVNAMFDAE